MRPTLSLVIPALVAIPSVAAHGFLYHLDIASKQYVGNVPNANANPSVIRQIDTVSPVKGANNTFLNCGQNATIASSDATAQPGDTLTFDWRGGDLSDWPHNTGPVMTYMASCGSTTCDQFNSENAQWFKIDQQGRMSNGTWYQQNLMNGGTTSTTLPSNIAPGNYLLRHEIIALHLATSMGGAEFYPSCSQLTIGGSGTGAPDSSELVTFPGGYSDSDPGIYDPQIYDTSAPYTFPGPPVAQFVQSSSSSGGGSGSNSTSSGATPTSTNPSSMPSGHCRLKPSNDYVVVNRPRQLSRIMPCSQASPGHFTR